MPETRRLPLAEACRALGISRRTAQRRLADGTLAGVKVGSRWLVDVALPTSDTPEARQAAATAALAAERDALRAQLEGAVRDSAEARQECALLRVQVASLTQRAAELEADVADARADRDRWQQAEAMARANVADALAVRGLLTERAEGAPWWRFWRRG